KVSHAHEDRLVREKQLLATIKDLNEERESEKIRLEEKLATLDVELTAIKEYQENSQIYEQTLKDMEAKIAGCKDAFNEEIALLNSQLEEEWETGRRDKEERRKITKKASGFESRTICSCYREAAAKATQEQLGPGTKHRIAQNKKIMSELRFQCFEVEKMYRARQGLMESNTLLLAKSASARHRVEELARRSHLLQRIIRYMHQKLQKRGACLDDGSIGRNSEVEDVDGCERPGASPETVLHAAGGGRRSGSRGRHSGTVYRLAGMSEEERQQMLDLREELRREEVAIAAAQTLVGEMSENIRRGDEERSRTLALKRDLARVLALCHEDPLVGANGEGGLQTESGGKRFDRTGRLDPQATPVPKIPALLSPQDATGSELLPPTLLHSSDLSVGSTNNGSGLADNHGAELVEGSVSTLLLPAIDPTRLSRQPQDWELENNQHDQQRVPQRQLQQHQLQPNHHEHMALEKPTRGADGADENDAIESSRGNGRGGMREKLALWPEFTIVPHIAGVGRPPREGGDIAYSEERPWEGTNSCIDAEVLKAVARLLLSKLQISVEAITPRQASPRTHTMGFPSLTKRATLENGGAGTESGVDMGNRQLRNSRRGPRRSRESTRTARRYGAGNGTSACSSRGQRRRVGRGGTLSDDQYEEGVSREGGRDRDVGRSRSGAPDDATSIWSGWHTTGIPSWDILEPAVRQTKRRRTRDAACQTLTYRELRDHAKTTGSMHNTSTTDGKNCDNNLSPPPRAVHQVHQRQRHQQARHHVVPASRYISMLNPPRSPVPSTAATTALSASSVYRTTDGGGIVHGAIVRGGARGADAQGMRPWPAQQQERLAGGSRGAVGDKLRHQRDEAQNPSPSKNGVERGGSLARPIDGEGTLLCSPPSSFSQQCSLHSSPRRRKGMELNTSSAPSARLSETPGTQRASPPLGQVSVSWNQEQDQGVEGGEEGTAPFTALPEPEMGVPKSSRSKRRPESLLRKGGGWSTRNHTVVGEKGSGSRSHARGGGFVHESLSKGPDYRKVLLFTVNDADCRVLRRPLATGGLTSTSETTTTAPSEVVELNTTDQRDGRRLNVDKPANGKRGSSRRSASRPRDPGDAAGTNFVRNCGPSVAMGAIEGQPVAATAAKPSSNSAVGEDLFVGNSGRMHCGSDGRISGIGLAGLGPVVGSNSVVWDSKGVVGDLDGGPTMCSSVSTLSGEAF
ncbi:unnamed protein product, partial [Ectocarpus sp. 12 AP-2014]